MNYQSKKYVIYYKSGRAQNFSIKKSLELGFKK